MLTTSAEAQRLFGLSIERMARRILKPQPTLTLYSWAERNRVLTTSTSSEAGPWRLKRVPAMRQIMEAFTDPEVREIVILKAARLGLTEGMINIPIGYIIDQDPGPILVVWPTKEDAQEWSKETLPDLFESTVCLRGKVRDAGEKDSDNTILHKKFAGGWLTSIGSNSARALRRRNARYVFIDEYDACDESKGSKEGDIGLRAARRADTFADAKIVKTGSPKLAATSRIVRDYLASDQHEFHSPCPHCGHWQVWAWRTHVQWEKERNAKGDVIGHKPETAHLVCAQGCGAVVEERHRATMVAAGEFRPLKPGREKRGFKLTTLLSLFPSARLPALVTEWIAAQQDPELLMTFVQTILAEPWEERGDLPDTDALAQRRETYAAEVPAGVAVLTAAVDIQDDRLELLIKGWGVGQESWDIEHHRIYGDPNAADRAVWSSLDRLLFRRFQHESGAQLTVRATCVDTGDGDHTDAAYAYCKKRRALGVYPVKGEKSRPGRPNVIRPGKAKTAGKRLFHIADDRLKRIVHRRLRIKEVGPGYIHFPVPGSSGLDAEYLEQFQNEVEQPIKRKDGSIVGAKFVKKGPNEALDLQKMNIAALHILGDGVMNYLPQLLARVTAEGVARGGLPAVMRAAVPLAPLPIPKRPARRSRVRFAGFQP